MGQIKNIQAWTTRAISYCRGSPVVEDKDAEHNNSGPDSRDEEY